ncbi:MAG: peptide chain release factor 1 [Fidelibacterota bacterium]
MEEKIKQIIDRYQLLGEQMSNPEIYSDQKKMKELAQEHSHLKEIVTCGKQYLDVSAHLREDREVLAGQDNELKELVQGEIPELEEEKRELEAQLKLLMLPKDPNDDKNIIVEIRAGTGGDEAALFGADLFRMYTRYAERRGWKTEILDSNSTGMGGLKEVIFSMEGKGVYGQMKFESGVHRVQRVPKTETSGRVHTSAATVAVLPEAEEADVEVVESDLKIDTYRASGAGGQHVNKTESAIRITHVPTGLVVTCQDEKSQHKNRASAMKVLRSRLLALEQERIAKERAEERKMQVSTGDRSAKIRTYNFPQGRVTDHRINLTLYNLEATMDGDIGNLIEQLRLADQQARLAAIGESFSS